MSIVITNIAVSTSILIILLYTKIVIITNTVINTSDAFIAPQRLRMQSGV